MEGRIEGDGHAGRRVGGGGRREEEEEEGETSSSKPDNYNKLFNFSIN